MVMWFNRVYGGVNGMQLNKGGPISSHTGRERKAMRVQAVDAPPPVLIAPEQSAQ